MTLGPLTPPSTPRQSSQKRTKLTVPEKSPSHGYVCYCGKPAYEWLCRTSIKNPDKIGKHFYKCEAVKCKFWAWEGDHVQRPRSAPKKCHCGSPALLLTAKHGMEHNVGRKFYQCRNRGKKGKVSCDFWIWEDGSLPFSETSQERFNDYMDGLLGY